MAESMLAEISRLRRMSAPELMREWERVFGSPPRTTNHQHLWRKLAWELQARTMGGLSDRARQRLAELGQDVFAEARATNLRADVAVSASMEKPPRPVRDLRMPSPGTVIVREYKGRQLRLTVLDGGYELDGMVYGSLTEAARAATGSHWNGRLFWGLTERKR